MGTVGVGRRIKSALVGMLVGIGVDLPYEHPARKMMKIKLNPRMRRFILPPYRPLRSPRRLLHRAAPVEMSPGSCPSLYGLLLMLPGVPEPHPVGTARQID